MFYVKSKIGNSAEINIEITDENVYTRCPICGEEFNIDIQDFLLDKDFDIFGTAVYCENCGKKVR
ncbi:MAG: hypothetical protein IJ583_12575 [Firmicutes bacterium]|nr:hypothetical protein [Bacillota bacterium]